MNTLDYGVIGNCKTAALISKTGSIDWLCMPNFDSPSVFCKLLDTAKGGCLSFRVAGNYRISQTYLRDTNILRTLFNSPEGTFEVMDFMPRYRTHEGEHYLPAEIYRYIRLLEGTPRFKVIYQPVMNYARETAIHKAYKRYIKTYSCENSRDNMYLYSSLPPNDILEEREVILEKDAYLLLSYTQKLVPVDINRVYLEYQRTKVYWLNWSNRTKKAKAYNEVINRSMLVLKLMSFQETGAVLAALTTSLPETIGEVRNWDYRFCWIRDASMSIETLIKLGHRSAAKRYIGFVKRILHYKFDNFQILYGINGERVLTEEILPHLAGYEHSHPVRIGNAAYNQKQNDSLGYLMDVIYRYYLHFPGTLDEVEETWEIVKNVIKTVTGQWRSPDQSIWEFRTIERHYVFSKVMSWVALDRAIKIASFLKCKEYEEEWKKEADIIKEDIIANGWNDTIKSFVQYYGSDEVDASLLLMEYYGFIEATDKMFVKTVKHIRKELFYKGLMFRYKNRDDFGVPTSAFTICTFWLVRALYMIGKKEEAQKIFDSLISYSNHVALFSEDLDFETKRLLGNFPQAYSHLALVNTAMLFTQEKVTSEFIRP